MKTGADVGSGQHAGGGRGQEGWAVPSVVMESCPGHRLCPSHLPPNLLCRLKAHHQQQRAGTTGNFHMQTLQPEDLSSKPIAGTLAGFP